MLLKSLQSLKTSKTVGLMTFNNLFKESHSFGSSVDFSNIHNRGGRYSVLGVSRMRLGTGLGYSFSTVLNRNLNMQEKLQTSLKQTSNLREVVKELKDTILLATKISNQRLNKCIQDEVNRQLQKFRKVVKTSAKTQQQQIKLVGQQKIRIQQKFRGNWQSMKLIEQNENHRAMIEVRLQILWNQNYEDLSIDEVVYLINELGDCKQLKDNQLRHIALVFLAVQAFRKCIKSPRINKNMICSTRTLTENLTYMKECFKGQMIVRSNLEKAQNLLFSLLNSIQKGSNRYSYMKFQSQLHYLTAQIFESFHAPDLYNDKSMCLSANPPRVVFEEPFHQEHDRFIEMAVLVLFDRRLKKQAKSNKLEHVKHVFQKIKLYQQGKLEEIYEKQGSTLFSIKKLKKKVIKMDKRVNLIQWIQNFNLKNYGK